MTSDMGAKKKPAYHHGDLRAALLATAWKMVSKDGVESLSLRAIALATGVSHAAPAHHFKDKAALIDALRVEAWKRFGAALDAGATRGLKGTGRAYIQFAMEHPRQVQLMFRAGDAPVHEGDAELLSAREVAWNVLVRGVREELPLADDQTILVQSIAAWAQVHGLATLWTELGMGQMLSPMTATELVHDAALDTILVGIRSKR